ncbi:hypothetical protein ABZV67_42335 [Streptomyces sp. NPDC005065]|uniref:hypothetical protein n=1 Tax=unclassified Streptomyces TaxID=2593676 RepID=UPI0033A58B74
MLGVDACADERLRLSHHAHLAALGGESAHLGPLLVDTDQQASIGLDWNAPAQSVGASALVQCGDEIVALVLTCVSFWAQAAIDQRRSRPWIVVRHELWRRMRSGGTSKVKKIDSDLRLSRASGTIQLLATHRLSDFEGVGAQGSEARSIATDLFSSCETLMQLDQDTPPLQMTREAIGLTDAECALIGAAAPCGRSGEEPATPCSWCSPGPSRCCSRRTSA